MKMDITNGKREVIAEIFAYTDLFSEDKEVLVEQILNSVEHSKDIGYAGWKTKEALKKHLNFGMFDYGKSNITKHKINKTEVEDILKETIQKCHSVIPSSVTRIFVFPCFKNFVKEKMGGVSGYTNWKNTITLFVYPTRVWKTSLKETFAHEYSHVVADYYFGKEFSLLDAFVYEGMAEHFREYVLGGEKSPWGKSLLEDEARKIFENLKNRLDSKDERLYRAVFFGGKEYPLWAGYAIGYYIFKKYLEKQEDINWRELIKLPADKIFNESGFFSKMILILLSGNSIYTKEWIESVEREFKDLFDSTYVHYYNHWKTGDKSINLDYEIEKLSEFLKDKKNYVIFGKSSGAVLALKGISEKRVSPKKCMFVGIPLHWCDELNIPLVNWIRNYKTPSYFIQKTKDPYGGTDELKEIFLKNNIRNFKLMDITGEDHHYEDLRGLKKLMVELIK